MKRLMLLLLCAVGAFAADAAPEADTILLESDRARGGHLPGLAWTIEIVAREGGVETRQVLDAVSRDGDTRVVYNAPQKMKGQFVLMLGRNMWFARPGLQKPVPLSPRQRLLGQAANGDVAATNYRDDYRATLVGEEEVAGEPCYVLDLAARSKGVTYDRIRYWVSRERRLGLRAEFFTVSGKRFKTATFAYDNTFEYEGRIMPFVSRMTIVDAINAENCTTMNYSHVVVRRPEPSWFQLNP